MLDKPAHTTEQLDILAAASISKSNIMIQALAGCIAAGTIITIRRGNDKTVRQLPIENLLRQTKPEIQTFVSCDVNGFAEYQPMLNCVYSGVKKVLRLETTFGEVLATSDHEIKTDNGWKALGSLDTNSWIFTREKTIQRGRKLGRITIYSVQHHPFAYQHNIASYGNYKRIHKARLVVEAAMNNLTLEEMILIVRHDPYRSAQLKYIDPSLEVHHKNEDPTDDTLSNLVVMSANEHRLEHKMHLQHTKLGISKVISVSDAGEQYTYDIAMPAPHHNFLANGHVVHNCGKTSTLEALVGHLPKQPILYLTFNKKNANEASDRMPSTTTVRTFNSIGHRVWGATLGKNLRLEPKKTQNILREIINESPKGTQSALWDCFYEVGQAVSLGKSLGYLPEGCYPGIKPLVTQGIFHSLLEEEPDDLAADLIDAVFIRSIKQSYEGLIDYNDQVYMPALFRGTFPQFPIILVDEYQDLSPANHALLARLVKGRIIGVGDPNQNIYGFRGAKAEGMNSAISHYSMDVYPLSTSFRCPSAIVNHVKWHVPTFRASKEGGSVRIPTRIEFSDIRDNSTIISRNNSPLLRCAFNLLSANRSITLAGSDIGPKLIGIMKRLGSTDLSKSQTLDAIALWESEKLAKESKTAEDLAGCMRVFAEHGSDLGQAIAYAEHLFKQTGTILLTTIHKAKGLEWKDVYHLDPWLVRRHPHAQNKNLDYVCSTRSGDSLTEIDSDNIQW